MHDVLTADTLAGVTVIDLTRLLPGPFCTMLLADLGARVIKIEPPGEGDYARWTPPVVVRGSDGYGAFFEVLNRGKQSVALDLKRPEGIAILKRLIASSDVVIESFRPGVMDRLGLGTADLKRLNGRLVVCSISSYGQDGPLAQRAGHDLNFLARSGALGLTGPRDGAPAIPAVQIGDLAGGALYAAFGIAAALFRRERTSLGARIDVSMTEGVLSLLAPVLNTYSVTQRAPGRAGDTLSGGLPCYRVYATADGGHLAVGALEPKFWAQVCDAIGTPDLVDSGLRYGEAGEEVARRVAAAIGTKPLSHWREVFAGLDACVEPVQTLADVVADEHLRARQAIRLDGTTGHVTPVPPTSRAVADLGTRLPPRLGEHSLQCAREAGLDEPAIEAAIAAGALVAAPAEA
ncbi:MAG: CoA transferase [Myxococcales bacterium]|nr:CoA transferase [Myxococcales bacterium]MCB9520600.1 CoA transferase [Myxococcales bacterium]MCB9531523.1 CoA transferase [Myxococcales bacterium]